MRHLADLEQLVSQKPPGRIAVAAAHEENVLRSVHAVYSKGYASPILIGDKEKIFSCADALELDVSKMGIIKETDAVRCAEIAVNLVQSAEADAIMKGQLQTADLLKAVLSRDKGLRTGGLLSHIGLYDVAGYNKLLLVTDAGINIDPNLQQKVDIIRNAVKVAGALGIQLPKVAVLAAIETVNPAMPSTLDAAALAKMADRGQIKDCLVDGPLAMDNAINLEAAKQKNIISPVAGDADILLVPDIEAGNILVKALTFISKARSCGTITGARVPLIVTSRAESSEAKYFSILLALTMLGHNDPEIGRES
ncbi:MAG: bifunctional enoyl-CoA hydratase/phosphate acetyltransferase [Ruminococcaceae bacterium]|jgi:phosphate butyryltransferase|nr:bifunctional enoyl-CoA hydratase/phosphate acetyltransferase [Oscillospiraceae bacterium]